MIHPVDEYAQQTPKDSEDNGFGIIQRVDDYAGQMMKEIEGDMLDMIDPAHEYAWQNLDELEGIELYLVDPARGGAVPIHMVLIRQEAAHHKVVDKYAGQKLIAWVRRQGG